MLASGILLFYYQYIHMDLAKGVVDTGVARTHTHTHTHTNTQKVCVCVCVCV
jgi:hypothetical protein